MKTGTKGEERAPQDGQRNIYSRRTGSRGRIIDPQTADERQLRVIRRVRRSDGKNEVMGGEGAR